VDGTSNRPLAGVVVRLNTGAGVLQSVGLPSAPGAAAPPAGQTPALTNSNGQFLFRALGAGRYSLSAQLGGFVLGSFGQTRPDGPSAPIRLAEGQRLTDVTIRLWKYGVVTGRVLDEAGEPAIGMSVRVLRRTSAARGVQWVPLGQVTTDDRGIYRLGSLVPGEFIVALNAGLATVPVSVAEEYMAAAQAGSTTALALQTRKRPRRPSAAGRGLATCKSSRFETLCPHRPRRPTTCSPIRPSITPRRHVSPTRRACPSAPARNARASTCRRD
jgi:hypothetical protein